MYHLIVVILITIFTRAAPSKLDDWWECSSDDESLSYCGRALKMEAGVLTLNVLHDGEVSANIGGKNFGTKEASMVKPATWVLFLDEQEVVYVEFSPLTSSSYMLVFYNIAYPTATPTMMPVTQKPSINPTAPLPSRPPTRKPTEGPTSSKPTPIPSPPPTTTPDPTPAPTNKPTNEPTNPPTRSPTNRPTSSPSWRPTGKPTTPFPTYTPPYSSSTTLETARLLLSDTTDAKNPCGDSAYLSLPPFTTQTNKIGLIFAQSSNSIEDCIHECGRMGNLCVAFSFSSSVCELYSSIPSIPTSICVSLADLSSSTISNSGLSTVPTFLAIVRNLFSSTAVRTLQSSSSILRLYEVSSTSDIDFLTLTGSSSSLTYRQELIFRSHNEKWEPECKLVMELDPNENQVAVFGIVNGVLLSAGNYARIFIESSVEVFFKESGIDATVESWSVVSDSQTSFLVLQTIRLGRAVTMADLRVLISDSYSDWITSHLQLVFKTDVSYLPLFVGAFMWKGFEDIFGENNVDIIGRGYSLEDDGRSPAKSIIDSMMVVGIVAVVSCVCIVCTLWYYRNNRMLTSETEREGEKGSHSKREDRDWKGGMLNAHRADLLSAHRGEEEPLHEPEGLSDSSLGYERDSLTLPGEPEYSERESDFGSEVDNARYDNRAW